MELEFEHAGRTRNGQLHLGVRYRCASEPRLLLVVKYNREWVRDSLAFYVDGRPKGNYAAALRALGKSPGGRRASKKERKEINSRLRIGIPGPRRKEEEAPLPEWKFERNGIEYGDRSEEYVKEGYTARGEPRLSMVLKRWAESGAERRTLYVDGKKVRGPREAEAALDVPSLLSPAEIRGLRPGLRGRKPRPEGSPRRSGEDWNWGK